MRAVIVLFMVLVSSAVHAGEGTAFSGKRPENRVETCEQLFKDNPEMKAQCPRLFSTKADCCLQYEPRDQVVHICSRVADVRTAIDCLTGIYWLRFWKYDLVPENHAGLASEFADNWTTTASDSCSSEPTVSAALSCAARSADGIKAAFDVANAEYARINRESDPILQNCRAEWKNDYAMIEWCVKRQRSAKERLGIE